MGAHRWMSKRSQKAKKKSPRSMNSLRFLTALVLIFLLLSAITVSATVYAPWKRVAVDATTSGDKECAKIGDANNDGNNKIISGNGSYIRMHEWSGSVWSLTVIDNLGSVTVYDLVIGDVDDTSRNKIAAALSNNTILLYNWTGSAWESSVVSTQVDNELGAGAENDVLDLHFGNADNQGGNKIVAGTESAEVVMFEWNGTAWNRTEIYYFNDPHKPVYNVDVADCDNNGTIEVTSISNRKEIKTHEYSGGSWTLSNVGSTTNNLLNLYVGDADNNGGNNIVVCDDNNDIDMYNWTGSTWQSSIIYHGGASTDIFDIKIGDVYNDGTNRIVAVDQNDTVIIYTWNTGTSSWGSFTVDDVAGGDVKEVTSGDADNDGLIEIVIGTAGGQDIYLYKAATIISCDSAGNEKNRFAPGENVSVKGYGLDPNTNYTIWIQPDQVNESDTINSSEDPSTGSPKNETVKTGAQGNFSVALIWSISPGATVTNTPYDIVVDNLESGTVGTYNAAHDGLDSASVAGIVAPVPEVSTIILFSVGLLTLAGYYRQRRRRN